MTPALDDMAKLRAAWQGREKTPFQRWVRTISSLFEESGWQLEAASREVGTNPAEFEAVLRLAMLDDDALKLFGSQPPPPTTWFLLASMDAAGIREALAALKAREPGQSPSSVLKRFDQGELLTTRVDRVAALEADVFYSLSAKAKRYGLLNDNSRKAIFDFGRRRKSGKLLSEKQAIWADALIVELISGGAIKRKSSDNDVEMCDMLLTLFDR